MTTVRRVALEAMFNTSLTRAHQHHIARSPRPRSVKMKSTDNYCPSNQIQPLRELLMPQPCLYQRLGYNVSNPDQEITGSKTCLLRRVSARSVHIISYLQDLRLAMSTTKKDQKEAPTGDEQLGLPLSSHYEEVLSRPTQPAPALRRSLHALQAAASHFARQGLVISSEH